MSTWRAVHDHDQDSYSFNVAASTWVPLIGLESNFISVRSLLAPPL